MNFTFRSGFGINQFIIVVVEWASYSLAKTR